MNPPGLQQSGFGHGSQNYNVYLILHDRYTFNPAENSWASTKQISRVVPGGVTRRINDIRVMLQPDKTLRGHVGWWVENKMETIYHPVLRKSVKYSWYRLVYMSENPGTILKHLDEKFDLGISKVLLDHAEGLCGEVVR